MNASSSLLNHFKWLDKYKKYIEENIDDSDDLYGFAENFEEDLLYKYCILTLDEYNTINRKNEGKCIVNKIDSIGRIKSVLITYGGYNFDINDIYYFKKKK